MHHLSGLRDGESQGPCAAIVDRLTFNGTIIETGTDSYRLVSTRARTEQPAEAGRPPHVTPRQSAPLTSAFDQRL
ncbi:hypothetical protein SMF913_25245 [Streptomyces malaysiensis]|uniref:Uncharacterized protein n=1 Tax=Streptomyces malaysiensis TaxID=92644 RepID=A0A2J7YP22_STRMQ|nr:hypothetical protein SMF913_25245 [Streptomyces malaysiensis]